MCDWVCFLWCAELCVCRVQVVRGVRVAGLGAVMFAQCAVLRLCGTSCGCAGLCVVCCVRVCGVVCMACSWGAVLRDTCDDADVSLCIIGAVSSGVTGVPCSSMIVDLCCRVCGRCTASRCRMCDYATLVVIVCGWIARVCALLLRCMHACVCRVAVGERRSFCARVVGCVAVAGSPCCALV